MPIINNDNNNKSWWQQPMVVKIDKQFFFKSIDSAYNSQYLKSGEISNDSTFK